MEGQMSLRQFIQLKLNELTDIEVGTELPDDMLVENQVYFSYLLQNNFENSDFDKNYTYNVAIIGYLKLKSSPEIDSLSVIDNAQKELKEKLKEINFHCSFNDVSIIDNIRKVQVRAYGTYNEINNGII